MLGPEWDRPVPDTGIPVLAIVWARLSANHVSGVPHTPPTLIRRRKRARSGRHRLRPRDPSWRLPRNFCFRTHHAFESLHQALRTLDSAGRSRERSTRLVRHNIVVRRAVLVDGRTAGAAEANLLTTGRARAARSFKLVGDCGSVSCDLENLHSGSSRGDEPKSSNGSASRVSVAINGAKRLTSVDTPGCLHRPILLLSLALTFTTGKVALVDLFVMSVREKSAASG